MKEDGPMACAKCYFFQKVWPRPGETAGYSHGQCCRYPQHVFTYGDNYCGEHLDREAFESGDVFWTR
jgi:hypothetical protein